MGARVLRLRGRSWSPVAAHCPHYNLVTEKLKSCPKAKCCGLVWGFPFPCERLICRRGEGLAADTRPRPHGCSSCRGWVLKFPCCLLGLRCRIRGPKLLVIRSCRGTYWIARLLDSKSIKKAACGIQGVVQRDRMDSEMPPIFSNMFELNTCSRPF